MHRRAQQAGRKPGELAARYLRESLVTEEYPGIVFVEGPAGRRAHIAGTGFDVWEVAMLIEDGADLDDLARERRIQRGLLHSAMRYAKDNEQEIRSFIPPLDAS